MPIERRAALDPRADLASLCAAQEWIDDCLARAGDALEVVRSEISGWSALQQLAHVALANELSLKNVAALADGAGLLVRRGGEPIAGARALLASGRFPRGVAQAPRMVRPPAAIDRALLARWLADGRRAAAAIDPAAVPAGDLKIPHQILGALDGREWLRFAAAHACHHLVIAAEVLRAAQGPALTDPPAVAPVPA
jgi:hypothetical protein